jgi:hypothetical protein
MFRRISRFFPVLKNFFHNKVLFFGAVLFFPLLSSAQLSDTIRYSLEQKPKFFINLTTFNSTVSGDLVAFSGFRAGVNFNKRIKFGAGFYGMNTKVFSNITVTANNDAVYDTSAELKLGFFSLSAEYIYYHNYPWQFGFIPYQLSLGEGHYEYIPRGGTTRVETEKQTIVLYEPNFTGQYSIFRWIGIGASVGYRFRLYSSKELREDLSSPTFSIGLRLFVDELYKMAFPHGLSKKEETPDK